MKLYFSPLACSLASRIVLHEVGATAELIEVDPVTKRTPAGDDYHALHPLGLVPALSTEDGWFTENIAILQYLADRSPEAKLAPAGGLARVQFLQWLSFISTELHKAIFAPQFDRKAPDAVKQYSLSHVDKRFDYLAAHLANRDHVVDDRFTVADAYLFTVLHWVQATPIALARWPALTAYLARHKPRPSIARAVTEEIPLYIAERKREQLVRASAG